MTRITQIILVAILLCTSLLTACAIEVEVTEEPVVMAMAPAGGSVQGVAGHHDHPMAPLSEMPVEVQEADERTQQAYQFAVANPKAAKEVPCYCGCVGLGHDSSYDCYVAEVDDNGQPIFDLHASSCSVCVEITLDQMQMIDKSVSPGMIRYVIDKTYAVYGPPTLMRGY